MSWTEPICPVSFVHGRMVRRPVGRSVMLIGGPILGPMLKSLHSGPRGGGSGPPGPLSWIRPWACVDQSAHHRCEPFFPPFLSRKRGRTPPPPMPPGSTPSCYLMFGPNLLLLLKEERDISIHLVVGLAILQMITGFMHLSRVRPR